MPGRNAGPPPVGQNQQEKAPDRRLATLDDVVKGMNRGDRYQTFVDLLGSKEAVDRWKAVALHTISTNNNLLMNASAASIIEACREAAVLGLDVTGLRGEGWLIVYDGVAKFQPGWQGLLKVILDTGRIRVADCQLVYENDGFELELGTEPRIRHQPTMSGEKQTVSKGAGRAKHEEEQYLVARGDVVGAYAWAKLESGELLIEWMTYADIEMARLASPAVQNGRSSPWDSWWGEMARKTVLRRLMKRLPRTAKVGQAIELDAQADETERQVLAKVSKPSARDEALAALPGGQDQQDDDQQPTDEEKAAAYDEAKGDGDEVVVINSDDAPDAKPVQPAEPPADPEKACDAPSPYGGGSRCVKPGGHDGVHRNGDKETWTG